jgi:hypothetical protein
MGMALRAVAFEQFLAGQVFDFPKLHRSCPDLPMT